MPKLKVQRTNKLSTRIHGELQELLIAGEYAPGERLKAAVLVEQTGTSITPVREALIRLVSENAIEMYSPRSFAVSGLSNERYREVRKMRTALEGLATELATENISEARHRSFGKNPSTLRRSKAKQTRRRFVTGK